MAEKTVRVNGQLAVSRAFGDMTLYPAVKPDPDMTTDRFTGNEVRGCRSPCVGSRPRP